MVNVHDVECPECLGAIEVCTSEADGFEMKSPFQVTCPLCGKDFVFHTKIVTRKPVPPDGSVFGTKV